jgi:threonine aldolase
MWTFIKDSMKAFASDNTSGVHPRILNSIMESNVGHAQSYGIEQTTERMNALFKETFSPQTEAFLVFNGSSANVLGLSALVRPHEGVICGDLSHLAVDECGAPEKWLGSKLFTTPTHQGKLRPADIEKHLIRKGDQHYSQPRAVSITQPTELGTTYTIAELKEISALCKKHGLYLHMDGARLANATAFLKCELKNITSDVGVDVLSFGGTKNGLLNVEAIVFFNSQLAKDFKFNRKQGMQLASKHRFQSCQFDTYLRTGLWKEIAEHVHSLAKLLEEELKAIPQIELVAPVESNGIFAKVPKSLIHPLKKEFFFYVWDEFENVVRWMITFDHTEKDIHDFVAAIKKYL